MPNGDIEVKDYVDRAIADVRHALDERFEEVRRAVDIAARMPPPDNVPVREYIEAIFHEYKAASEMAEREREKAAQALNAAHERALSLAEAEREKSAQALATNLARAILEGDDRLREHIANQVMQINAALESAEKLELQRLEQALARINAVQRELQLVHNASEKAIEKAEAANEKQFAAGNEWRGQSADRERTQQEQMTKLTATFIPREVADAKYDELRRALGVLESKVGKIIE